MQIADLDRFKGLDGTGTVDATYDPTVRTFYSPIDDVHGALAHVIGSAQRSVIVSMYGFDDDELATLLLDHLHNPAMHVQITLDRSQAGGKHEKAILDAFKADLTGNSVAIGVSERGAILHRKMVLVDGLYRLSGSTNWSDSGERLQGNELTVWKNAAACAEARHAIDLEHTKALKDMIGRRANGREW